MRTLGSHSGYLEIDHRDSPGLTLADVAHVPGAIAVPKGAMLERDVKQCTHCQRAVVLNPGRVRTRAVCPKCYHYICDSCERLRVATGQCVPFTAVLERVDAGQESDAFAPLAPRVAVSRSTLDEILATAQAFYAREDWDAAEPYVRQLIVAGVRLPAVYDSLGTIRQFQGHIDEALAYCRQALEVDPSYQDAYDRVVMLTDVLPETTAADSQAVRAWWWEHRGQKRLELHDAHNRTPDRPLRVGYVSGDFWHHSACAVFSQIALHHTEAIQPYFYSSTPKESHDAITQAFQQLPGWRDARAWTTQELTHAILADEIDILIDLSGFTLHNRLDVFAAKPAPIQMTGWGYATGLGWPDGVMDYVLADAVVMPTPPQGSRVASLPCVLPYTPMDGLPEPNPLPCLTQAPTFGVFQRALKINNASLTVWRTLLERMPESRLVIKGDYCGSFVAWMTAQLEPVMDRVTIISKPTNHDEHLRAYQDIDLMLDTWPQTGGVTSCEALWMGVPMVTLIGERVIQRTSAALLTNLGLTDFITETTDEYLANAIAWVTWRKDELAAIRQGVRGQYARWIQQTPYLEAVEASYRSAWQTWCDRDADTLSQ